MRFKLCRRFLNISREDSVGRRDPSREEFIGESDLFLLFLLRVLLCLNFFLGGPEASIGN